MLLASHGLKQKERTVLTDSPLNKLELPIILALQQYDVVRLYQSLPVVFIGRIACHCYAFQQSPSIQRANSTKMRVNGVRCVAQFFK